MNKSKNVSLEPTSNLMKLFLKLGLRRIAWSFRRFHVPVPDEALVLEVGSGGNPYYRSNVLLDAYEETRERHFVPLISDRPTVLGFVEDLPFKDHSFDFVIASHVLEHSAHPERFLKELMRVARAGYIEVPDAFMERLNPYLDHRLEITERDGVLTIYKKGAWKTDPNIVELCEARGVNDLIVEKIISRYPFNFHVRCYWTNEVDFHVVNPDVNAEWPAELESNRPPHTYRLSRLQAYILKLARRFLSQKKRNLELDVLPLLQCPTCKSGSIIQKHPETLCCVECSVEYPQVSGVPRLFRRAGFASTDF